MDGPTMNKMYLSSYPFIHIILFCIELNEIHMELFLNTEVYKTIVWVITSVFKKII